MRKKNFHKILAAAVAAHIIFSPLASLAAEIDFENATPTYQNVEIPESALDFVNRIKQGATGAQQQGNKSASLEEANQEDILRWAAKKQQQQNETSGSTLNTYFLSNNGYAGTVAQENPCWPCGKAKSEACPDPWATRYLSNTNQNGYLSYNNGVPACVNQVYKSNGEALTAEDWNDVSVTRQFAQGNYQPAQLFSIASRMSKGDKEGALIALAFMALSNIDSGTSNALSAEEYAELSKKDNHEDAKDRVTTETQSTRQVLSNVAGDAPYTVKLTPEVPSVADGKDVFVTLVPKKKRTEEEAGKYSITAKVRDLSENKDVTIDAVEDSPFRVELGSWTRFPGTRTVVITYTDNDTGREHVSSFSYTVASSVNILTDTGNTVSNSVVGAIMNADIFASSGQSFPISGKVVGAEWDGARNICKVTVADDNIANGERAIVETGNLDASKCSSSTGTYLSMSSVNAQIDPVTGQIRFTDTGAANSQSIFGRSLDDYLGWQETSNLASYDNKGIDKQVLQIKMSNSSGANNIDGYLYGGLGQIGSDWLIFPNGQTIGVKADQYGGYWYSKPDGSSYSDAELDEYSLASGIDLSKVRFSIDDNGELVGRIGDSKVTRNQFIASDLENNASAIFSKNKERLTRPSSQSVLGIATDTIKAMGQSVGAVIQNAP